MKKRWLGIGLALTISVFSWLYTIKKDYWKLVLSIIIILLANDFIGTTAGMIFYVLAILDHLIMPDKYYTKY